jgi:hypothetical protein
MPLPTPDQVRRWPAGTKAMAIVGWIGTALLVDLVAWRLGATDYGLHSLWTAAAAGLYWPVAYSVIGYTQRGRRKPAARHLPARRWRGRGLRVVHRVEAVLRARRGNDPQ